MDVLQKGWKWLLGLGILLVILGLLLIAAPAAGTLAVDVLIGWFLVIGGIAQIVHAFMEKAWSGFLLELLSGILYGAVGVLLLAYPLAGVAALTLLLAAFLALEGAFRINASSSTVGSGMSAAVIASMHRPSRSARIDAPSGVVARRKATVG